MCFLICSINENTEILLHFLYFCYFVHEWMCMEDNSHNFMTVHEYVHVLLDTIRVDSWMTFCLTTCTCHNGCHTFHVFCMKVWMFSSLLVTFYTLYMILSGHISALHVFHVNILMVLWMLSSTNNILLLFYVNLLISWIC